MNEEPKRANFAKEEGEIVLREHEYDGIQEYDQKLPNWWLFTFYGGVAWLVIYWVLYYNIGFLKSDHDLVTEKITALHKAQLAELEKTLATLDDSALVYQWAKNPELVAAGEVTYLNLCSSCHAADLSATLEVSGQRIPLPGLALNDGQWKFGRRPMDIFKIINDGSPEDSDGYNGAKMQPWSQMLTPKQVAEVTAYIVSMVPGDFLDIPLVGEP
jgi:cytochrome c oxidase cbb3-type subunit 3